jgi:hypothetical protein
MIEVVCGVIYNEHAQILICQRAKYKTSLDIGVPWW